MVAMVVAILAASMLLPVLSAVTAFVLPVPFILYAKRNGIKAGIIMMIAASIISALLMTIFTLPLVLMAAFGGLFIGYAMRKQSTPYETLAQGTFGFIIGILITFVFMQVVFNINIIEQYEEIVEESVDISTSLVGNMNLGVQSEDIQDLMAAQVNILKNLLPTFMVLFAFLMSFIAQWISYKLLNRIEKTKMHFPPFREMQFPSAVIWIYLLALILSLIGAQEGGTLQFGAENLLMIVGLILSLQGFSFIFYFAHIKKISKAIPIVIVVITILFPTFLLYFIRILGIIDIGFQLRSRLK